MVLPVALLAGFGISVAILYSSFIVPFDICGSSDVWICGLAEYCVRAALIILAYLVAAWSGRLLVAILAYAPEEGSMKDKGVLTVHDYVYLGVSLAGLIYSDVYLGVVVAFRSGELAGPIYYFLPWINALFLDMISVFAVYVYIKSRQ